MMRDTTVFETVSLELTSRNFDGIYISTLKNGSRHDEIRGQGVEFVDQAL